MNLSRARTRAWLHPLPHSLAPSPLHPCQRRTKRIPVTHTDSAWLQCQHDQSSEPYYVCVCLCCAWRRACANTVHRMLCQYMHSGKFCCHCGKYSRIIPYLTIVIRWTYPNMTALYGEIPRICHFPVGRENTQWKLVGSDFGVYVSLYICGMVPFQAKSNVVPSFKYLLEKLYKSNVDKWLHGNAQDAIYHNDRVCVCL